MKMKNRTPTRNAPRRETGRGKELRIENYELRNGSLAELGAGCANQNPSSMVQFTILNFQFSISLLSALALLFVANARADFAVRHVEIAPRAL